MPTPRGLLDAPATHATAELFGQLNFHPNRRRCDWSESDSIELIQLHAIFRCAFHRFPVIAILVKQSPALRHAALAVAGVVEPVDFAAADRAGMFEIVLEPFGAVLVVPPVEISGAGVVG